MANYTIIGGDGKPYGPVADYELQQWIRDGRIEASARVRMEGENEWKGLADLPEFFKALPAKPSSPPPVIDPPKGSPGVAGLVIGIIAGALLLLIILAGFALPALARVHKKALATSCLFNEKQLAIAVRIYTAQHNNHFPPAATWCDAIKTEVKSDQVFKCPGGGQRSNRCDYAYNARLDGIDLARVNPNTVLVFESDGDWNTAGGPELLLRKARHGGTINIVFADGSVQPLSSNQLETLRWNP